MIPALGGGKRGHKGGAREVNLSHIVHCFGGYGGCIFFLSFLQCLLSRHSGWLAIGQGLVVSPTRNSPIGKHAGARRTRLSSLSDSLEMTALTHSIVYTAAAPPSSGCSTALVSGLRYPVHSELPSSLRSTARVLVV